MCLLIQFKWNCACKWRYGLLDGSSCEGNGGFILSDVYSNVFKILRCGENDHLTSLSATHPNCCGIKPKNWLFCSPGTPTWASVQAHLMLPLFPYLRTYQDLSWRDCTARAVTPAAWNWNKSYTKTETIPRESTAGEQWVADLHYSSKSKTFKRKRNQWCCNFELDGSYHLTTVIV